MPEEDRKEINGMVLPVLVLVWDCHQGGGVSHCVNFFLDFNTAITNVLGSNVGSLLLAVNR